MHPFGRSTWTAAVVAMATLGLVPGALALWHAPVGVLVAAFALGLIVYTALVWRFRVLFSLDVLRQTATRRGATA